MVKQINNFFLALLVVLTTATGLSAQKKYLVDGEKPEIQKDAMSLVSWLGDESAILAVRGAPNSMKPVVYTEVKAKTGKQIPYTGDTKSLFNSKQDSIVVTSRNGNIFYRVGAGKPVQLTSTEAEEKEPVLSPNKEYVAFIRNNNLYTIRLADRKETQLTFDGSDVILNGYASWVYMEDVLTGKGYGTFWWSPDSKCIAFYRFDDSQVPIATIADIRPMPEKNNKNSRIPDDRTEEEAMYDYQHIYVETAHYPKAGDKNPMVKVGFAKPDGGVITWADFKENDDCYFGTPSWQPDAKGLWVQWLNRGQDTLVIYSVDPTAGSKKEIYRESQKTWVTINYKNRINFLASGKGVIIGSDKSGWDQLYLYDLNGKLINPITNGEFKVLDILHIDEKTQTIYFTCFKDNVAYTDLYKVSFNGKNMKRLTFGNYSHKPELSPSAKYFITTYCNPSTPDRVALLNTDGKLIAELYDRKGADFDLYEMGRTEILTVKSEDGKFDIPMRVMWPAGMEKGKKYPLQISIYGGPNMMWQTQAHFSGRSAKANDEKFISVAMDHRASGLCGKVGADYVHRNLGYWELNDYTQCVKWLIENGQVDPEKVLIRGHSYGGYLTCYALTYGADVFKFGMAGAPVTDWMFYNSAYTERYMDSPKENPEGYRKSSPITYVDKYKGRLLIAHGMSDDNVHVQNTLQLAGELQKQNKQNFEMMLYPGDRHSMLGKHTTHFYELQRLFMMNCFFGCSESKPSEE